jgi:hypothetical protein
MKKMLWMIAAAVMVFSTACGVEPSDSDTSGGTGSDSGYGSEDGPSGDEWDGSSGNSSKGIKSFNWNRDACESFGGTITATGGCYLACTSDADCPESSECNMGTWSISYCTSTSRTYGMPSTCTTGGGDSGDGYEEMCHITCDESMGDAQCPPNFKCKHSEGAAYYGYPHDGFCSGYLGGSSDGGGSGVCSGCGGISCSGRCTGCPGCY